MQSYIGQAVPIDPEVVREQVEIFARYHAAGIIPYVPDVRGGYDPQFNPEVEAAKRATPRT